MRSKRLRILLIDRDGDRRQEMQSKLYAALRYPSVITALSEDRHRPAMPEDAFDICVLSLSPDDDAIREVRAVRSAYCNLPIIIVDSPIERKDLERLLDCGVQDHIPRRCVDCPTNQRASSSIEWAVERGRLLRHIEDVHEEFETRALHDPLTGLPNRKLFVDRLQQLILRWRRTKERFAVLFVDLDRFKRVNDTLGHDVGDRLLIEVALRLKGCLRTSDTCARWGGDEFLVTLENTYNPRDVKLVARKITEQLAKPFQIGEFELRISASIGVSFCPRDGRYAPTLIRQADLAMYRAKAAGGDRVQCFYGEMQARAQDELRVEDQLGGALERGELSLVYQPQVNLRTHSVIGFEALARWTHPHLGTVPPDRFIPLAEKSGLIVPIGEWVIAEACRRIVSWRDAGLQPVPVAVNVSGRQLQRPGFEETVTKSLAEYGVQGHEFEIELTETSVVDDPERVGQTLRKLLAIGVRTALDDFGTGYSSLGILGRFPFSRIKIDKSFVRGIPNDPKAVGITSAIVHMARSLGMRTIAEGVERTEQVTGLLEPGCEEAQGFLFSPPVPGERTNDFFRGGAIDLIGPV